MRNKRLIIIFSILLAITIVVLLSSIIFSVKNINTRCLNSPELDAELDTRIVESVGLPKGKNIFLVNEQKVMESIHSAVPNVRVINLESKFPSRITVHYVKLFDYYQLPAGGNSYYSLTFDGRVIEENTKSDPTKITVISDKTGSLEKGQYVYEGRNQAILKEIIASFERLDLKDERAGERFSFVDLENEHDCLYIGMTNSPIVIKINKVSEIDLLFGKIRLGYSVFLSDKFDRQPNAQGVYKMINVVSPTSSMDPLNDYRG